MKRRMIAYLCATSALALAPPAFAQPSSAESETVAEVVVTGSRIETGGYERPTPVTVATSTELLKAQPANLGEALIQQLPALSGSTSPNTLGGFIATQAHGSYLNLRNLGASRTLVLQDGERVPPTTFDGLVNAAVIPDLLVQRVDVVTGGVSAIYGSDAVAGVVNFILDKKFTGAKLEAQGGISSRNDDKSWKAGIAVGKGFFDDRMHVLLSYQHSQQDGLFKDDRKQMRDLWLAVPRDFPSTIAPGTPGNPLVFRKGVVSNTTTLGGTLLAAPPNPAGKLTFNAAGQLIPFDPGIPTSSSSQIGGSGLPLPIHRNLVTKTNSDHAYGRLSFDLTDKTTAALEVNVGEELYTYTSGLNYMAVPLCNGNPFLPASVVAGAALFRIPNSNTAPCSTDFIYSPGNAAVGIMFKVPEPEFPTIVQTERDKNASVKLAFNGEIHALADWKWNAYYSYGRSEFAVDEGPEIQLAPTYAALDAVVNPANGQIVCNITLTNPSSPLAKGCVPWNPFGVQNANNKALQEYVTDQSRFDVINKLHDVAFNFTGHPFSTWAGPVGFAAGAEYRHGKLTKTSNSGGFVGSLGCDFAVAPGQPGCTGQRTLPNTSLQFVTTSTGAAAGSESVWEVNAETEVPLVRDVPFVHDFTFTGAVRYTDYSVSGGATTWKAGATWAPIEDIRFRIARSRDIRAPNLYDLFQGLSGQKSATFDPHTNQFIANGIVISTQGNTNLKSEIGKTTTIGVVLQPKFLPRFQASVDYYDIKIQGAITRVSAAEVLSDCEGSGGTSPFCALITRPFPFSNRSAANIPSTLIQPSINAAFFRVKGIDFDVTYLMNWNDIFESATAQTQFRALVNYVSKSQAQNNSSSPLFSTAGWTDAPAGLGGSGPTPHWRGSFSATIRDNDWSLFLQERWIGKLKAGAPYIPTFSNTVYAVPDIKDTFYTDLTLSYDLKSFGGRSNLYLTVNNVFDKQPPIFPLGGAASVPGLAFPTIQTLYDVIGRYYTAGVRMRF